jgi:transcriptional regulator with XRE-family HTH domain
MITMEAAIFGEYLQELRRSRDQTLRAYCAENGEDPAYISRLERGMIPPPKDRAVLERLAKSVGLKPGTEQWDKFHDLADVAAGRIPARVMEDSELVKHLPLFFRTITGERFPDEKLDELIAYVREKYEGRGD